MKPQFTLTAVPPLKGGVLRLEYADGHIFDVDIKPIARRSHALLPLKNVAILSTARLGECGASVVFNNHDALLAADNLRVRAIEQQGGYSHKTMFKRLD